MVAPVLSAGKRKESTTYIPGLVCVICHRDIEKIGRHKITDDDAAVGISRYIINEKKLMFFGFYFTTQQQPQMPRVDVYVLATVRV